MKLLLETYDGEAYTLPTLLWWDVDLTGSVPCDSLEAAWPYDPGMAEVLPKAVRFTATENGRTVLRGVVDAYEITMDSSGLLASMEGRGMCALLLDNESEAVTYERATLREILDSHAAPYGIKSEIPAPVSGGPYVVDCGSSQWKAISGFTGRFGGFQPYFLGDGTLTAAPLWGSGGCVTIGGGTPLLSLTKREQRYGVISEMLIWDKKQNVRHVVPNQKFIDQGGSRRHVLYMPRSTDGERRYTGEYQIAQSALEQLELSAVLPYPFAATPGGKVSLALDSLSLSGTYDVVRAHSRMDDSGERTELTLSVRDE